MEQLPSWYVAALQQAWAEGRDIRHGIAHHMLSPTMDFREVFHQITRLPWRYWTLDDKRMVAMGSTFQHVTTHSPVVAQRIGQVWMGAEKALRQLRGIPTDPTALWLPFAAHWELYRTHALNLMPLNDQALQRTVAEHPAQCQQSRAEQWLLRHHWDPHEWYPFHEGTGSIRRAPFWGMWSLVPGQAAVMADMDASWAYRAQAHLIAAIIARTVSTALISEGPPSMPVLLLRSINHLTPHHKSLRDLVATLWQRERQGIWWDEELRWVAGTFHYYPWDHCIPNFLIVIIALLYAQQDFDNALKIVRSAGWDVAGNTLLTGVFMALDTSIPPDPSLVPLLSPAIQSMVRRLYSFRFRENNCK
jgi:hypothetical protein